MTSGDDRFSPGGEPITPDGERFAVSDDALGAMLQARAGRVPAGAADTVRARVRAGLHERRPGGILGFLPIGDRAGAMSGWAGWGAAIAAAVLVIAVLGGRPTSDPGTTATPPSTLTSPVPSPAVSAAVSEEPGQTVLLIEQAGFALAVADGSLDGQIVLVNGALNGGSIACTEARCEPFWFAGLEDIPVDWTGPLPEPGPVYPASTPVPGVYDWWDGPFLVRPGGGRLELLGYLAGVLHNPVSVKVALEDPRGYPNASSPFDILPVDGYLIAGRTAADCPATGHLLTDIHPFRRGPPVARGSSASSIHAGPRLGRRGRGPIPRTLRQQGHRVMPAPDAVFQPRLGPEPHGRRPVPRPGHRPRGPALDGDPHTAALADADVDPRAHRERPLAQRELCR